MLDIAIQSRKWTESFIRKAQRKNDWNVLPVFVRSSKNEAHTPYIAVMWFPATWIYHEELGLYVNPLQKRHHVSNTDEKGHWIFISSKKQENQNKGLYVFVEKSGINEWTISKTEEGSVKGAKLTHLLAQSDSQIFESGEFYDNFPEVAPSEIL